MYEFSMFQTREADLIRAAEHRRLVREAEAGKAREKAREKRGASGRETDGAGDADDVDDAGDAGDAGGDGRARGSAHHDGSPFGRAA